MLIGSNRKLESKVALTVSIFDHNVNNVNTFKYLGIFISSDYAWTNHVEYIACKINQRLGIIALSIYYLLLYAFFFFIIVLSCLYLIMQTLFGETSVM